MHDDGIVLINIYAGVPSLVEILAIVMTGVPVQSIVMALLLDQFVAFFFICCPTIDVEYCADQVFCWSIGTDGSCVELSCVTCVSIIFESIMFESIMSSIMSSIGRRGC